MISHYRKPGHKKPMVAPREIKIPLDANGKPDPTRINEGVVRLKRATGTGGKGMQMIRTDGKASQAGLPKRTLLPPKPPMRDRPSGPPPNRAKRVQIIADIHQKQWERRNGLHAVWNQPQDLATKAGILKALKFAQITPNVAKRLLVNIGVTLSKCGDRDEILMMFKIGLIEREEAVRLLAQIVKSANRRILVPATAG